MDPNWLPRSDEVADRHSERAAYLGLGLDFSSYMEVGERLDVADFAAEEIRQLAERVTNLRSLGELHDNPIGAPRCRHSDP